MAYDSNVTSSVLNLQSKRRLWRMDFQRPPVEGDNSLIVNGFLREDILNATAGSPTSGSVIASTNWLININRSQVLSVSNAGSFLNGIVALFDTLKTEYDASGSLATGSVSIIP